MFLKEKKNLIIFFSFLILLTILLFVINFIFLNRKPKKINGSNMIIPTEELIPTVDSSVKVSFKTLKKGEVLLTITNEPKNTENIDFELNYKVFNNDIVEGEKGTIEQGALGKCYRLNNSWQCGEDDKNGGRKIVLGTCSSGVCRYHDIVGSVKVILKFVGDYGEKIFEKEFNI